MHSSTVHSLPWRLCFATLLLACLQASAVRLRVPGPYIRFHTEPNFIPNMIATLRMPTDRSELAPGYIFIAPHISNKGFGPQIIDQEGKLVWYGFGTVNRFQGRKTYAMNLYVCDYKGEIGNHLCYSEARPAGNDVGIRTAGANRVFNSSYDQVGPDYGISGNFTWPNPHEFAMLPGGNSFLQAVYDSKTVDLTPYAGEKEGHIFNGCFQEVDTRTEDEIFRWCFLDHHPIWETHLFLNIDNNTVNISTPVGGSGTLENPWDFMHLNAVDKNDEGDYLVSGRHLNSIIKVAGPNSRSGQKPGTTLWRIGGKTSDFKIESDESAAHFTMQHHCRFEKITKNETTITLFNNAYNGFSAPSTNYSAAITLVVNNETMTARLENIFKQPQSRLAYAQGSMQTLPNGNILVGWGARPQWSEFSLNGTLLHHAGARADGGKLSNYRTYKFPWVGKPKTAPKLVAYCKSCESTNDKTSPLVAYASWNGATEVKYWRFYVSFKNRAGPWVPAGKFLKTDFETQARLSSGSFPKKSSFAPFVAVEAVDASGKVLGKATRKTFVPNRKVKHLCTRMGCKGPYPEPFYYVKDYNRAETCMLTGYGWIPQAAMLVVFLMGIECITYLSASLILQMSKTPPGRGRKRKRGRYDYLSNGKIGDA